MTATWLEIDQCLRAEGGFAPAPDSPLAPGRPLGAQLRVIVLCGALYGACMGGFGGILGDGWKQILLSASKIPLLFLVTFLLCLPSFFVMNGLAGLREDFARVAAALLGFQCIAAIVLAALGPVTILMNVSTGFYPFIKLWNGVIFAVASLAGHYRMATLYRPLIGVNGRHRIFLRVWIVLYSFVGIQMAWVMRPFVGSPGMPFEVFREEAWGNAYVELLHLALRVVRHLF
jgi:hypothetical protein